MSLATYRGPADVFEVDNLRLERDGTAVELTEEQVERARRSDARLEVDGNVVERPAPTPMPTGPLQNVWDQSALDQPAEEP